MGISQAGRRSDVVSGIVCFIDKLTIANPKRRDAHRICSLLDCSVIVCLILVSLDLATKLVVPRRHGQSDHV